MSNDKRSIELMDTTLRDGEQTQGVSYAPAEKVNLAKALLTQLKVDRIEVASPSETLAEATSMRSTFSCVSRALARLTFSAGA